MVDKAKEKKTAAGGGFRIETDISDEITSGNIGITNPQVLEEDLKNTYKNNSEVIETNNSKETDNNSASESIEKTYHQNIQDIDVTKDVVDPIVTKGEVKVFDDAEYMKEELSQNAKNNEPVVNPKNAFINNLKSSYYKKKIALKDNLESFNNKIILPFMDNLKSVYAKTSIKDKLKSLYNKRSTPADTTKKSFYYRNKKKILYGAVGLVFSVVGGYYVLTNIDCSDKIAKKPKATVENHQANIVISTETVKKYTIQRGNTLTGIVRDFFNINQNDQASITEKIISTIDYNKINNPEYMEKDYDDSKAVIKIKKKNGNSFKYEVVNRRDGIPGDNIKAGKEILLHKTGEKIVTVSWVEKIDGKDTTKINSDGTLFNLEEKAKECLNPDEIITDYHIQTNNKPVQQNNNKQSTIENIVNNSNLAENVGNIIPQGNIATLQNNTILGPPDLKAYRLSDYKGIDRINKLEMITQIYMTADSLKSAAKQIQQKLDGKKISLGQIYYAVNRHSKDIGRKNPVRRFNAMDKIEYQRERAYAA